MARTLPCVRGCGGGAVIVGCNNGTVVGRSLGRRIVRSVVLLELIKIEVILMRNNNPRVARVLGGMNGGSIFISKLHIASGRAIRVTRVILTNGVGGGLMGLLRIGNNGTVKVSNVSNELVATRPGGRGLNCINAVAGIGVRPVISLVTRRCVPIMSAINYSGSNGICGVGTSATTTCVTNTLGTRYLVSVASVTNVLGSGSGPRALVPGVAMDRTTTLFRSNAVSNNVVPGIRYYLRTVDHNIGGIFVVSNEVPRSLLVRALASRNTKAVMINS